MDDIDFTVYGDPVAQGRPKFTRAGKFPKAYDPKPSRDYKAYVKLMAANVRPHKPLSGPLSFSLTVYRRMPKSLSKKRKAAAKSGALRPTVKPDADNFFKSISDALTGLIYEDDKQIVDVRISKYYGEIPRAEIRIKELETL